MQKVPGVDAARVSLNEGLTVLDLRAGNAVTLEQLRAVLKRNGFVSKEARVTARGTAALKNARLWFTVAGSGETFELASSEASRAAYADLERRARTAAVELEELKGSALPGTKMTFESARDH
jgi:hypothetical protein